MLTLNFAEAEIQHEYNLIAVAQALAVLVAVLFIDHVERRRTLGITFVLAGASMIAAVSQPEEHGAVAMLFVLACFWEEIIWLTLYIVAGEVYPSVIRNTASGLLMGPNRIGGVISSILGQRLMQEDPALPFALHGALLIAGGAAAFMLRTDKTGKELADQM